MSTARIAENVKTLFSSWQEVKLFVEHSLGFNSDSLHVIVGALLFLGIALLMRKPVSTPPAWLVLLGLTVLNELVDLWVDQWPSPGQQFGEGMKDLLLTMLVPTVLMITARWVPRLYGRPETPPEDLSPEI